MEIEILKAPEKFRPHLSAADDIGNKNKRLDTLDEAKMAVGICRYDSPKDLPGIIKYLNENGYAVKMEMDIASAPERFKKHMTVADSVGNKNGKIDSLDEAKLAAKLCKEYAPGDLKDMWDFYDDSAFMIMPEKVEVRISFENAPAQEK
jgi:hypothetical protein